ncbi:MAG TPA: response regulator transcription factor [Thermoanaerobaculia bacterium]|nr:response regulator transcription factor [Thermoanaerobaculia bacterium]
MDATLVLADDHPIVLDGLEQLFRLEAGLEVVARCRDGEETLQAVRSLAPDVLVLDVRMPGGDGLAVLHTLEEEGLPTRVVLLTAGLEDEQLLEAIRAGARGVVLKDMAPQLLVEAVRTVLGGGQWLEQGLGGRALTRLLQRERGLAEAARHLTPRELEIVRMVASGLRNRAIADRLYITEGTVKVHLHNIYEKLGVDGRWSSPSTPRRRGWSRAGGGVPFPP